MGETAFAAGAIHSAQYRLLATREPNIKVQFERTLSQSTEYSAIQQRTAVPRRRFPKDRQVGLAALVKQEL